MAIPKIKNTAVLIGYNLEGKCVYSDIRPLFLANDGTLIARR